MLMKHKHGEEGVAADAKASRGAHAPSRVPTGALAGRFPQGHHFNVKSPEFNPIQGYSTLFNGIIFPASLSFSQGALLCEPQQRGNSGESRMLQKRSDSRTPLRDTRPSGGARLSAHAEACCPAICTDNQPVSNFKL
jgi:hypothetical protein